MTYHRIIRNEEIQGEYIRLDAEQARTVESYITRFRAGLGYEPVGLHWIPELGDFVFLPSSEGIVERQ